MIKKQLHNYIRIKFNEMNIPGYIIVRRDRNHHGRGLASYVREDIAFRQRQDINNRDLELIAIDILLPKLKPIVIITCYRPPTQSNFFQLLEESLLSCDRFIDLDSYILGDINGNTLQGDTSKNKNLVKVQSKFCKLFDLTQIITTPTRVTSNSASLIDHIYVSDTQKVYQFGVLSIGLSDHYLSYCTRKICKGQINKHNTRSIRSMEHYPKDNLSQELSSQDWSNVTDSNDVDLAWLNFKSIFTSVLNVSCFFP